MKNDTDLSDFNDVKNNVKEITACLKVHVEETCKKPYPKENFFAAIARRCITDAHGTGFVALSGKELCLLWMYLKQEALSFIQKVQREIVGKSSNEQQLNYYCHIFETDKSKLNVKLALLNKRFSLKPILKVY